MLWKWECAGWNKGGAAEGWMNMRGWADSSVGQETAGMLSGRVQSLSSPFTFFTWRLCMWSFWSVHPMFSTNWRSMSVYMYIFAQMSSWVISMCPCVSVWRLTVCMYVCVCTCHRAPSASCSSAAECCVLSLLSCCRRNSAAAAPLPHFLFSLPLPWLTTWPPFILRHHLPPPAGYWQPCSRRIKMAHMRTNGGRRGSVLWNDVALESEEHHYTLQYIIW